MTILETNPKGTKPEVDMTCTCTDGNELSCQVEMAGAVWIQKPAHLFSQKTISRLESHQLLPASSVSFTGLCFFQYLNWASGRQHCRGTKPVRSLNVILLHEVGILDKNREKSL